MSYYATASGRKIDIQNFTEDDIYLDDIAHHLAKICRYGGSLALDKHYSVASHSMELAQYCLDNNYGEEMAAYALLHDASEAYLGDIVSGLKALLPDYQRIERAVQYKINLKYGLGNKDNIAKLVKKLDTRIVIDEAAAFMPQFYDLYKSQIEMEPLNITIVPDGSLFIVKRVFLKMCELLGIKE